MDFIPMIAAFVLIFTGVPVGIALLSSALLYFGFFTDTLALTGIVQRMVSSNMSTSLLTIPLFLMVGTVMSRCGISKRLMRWCNALVGHVPGGLAQVNVVLSTVNGGMCGSSGADAAQECKTLVPEMIKLGYPVGFCAAVTAASAMIAPMIPPGNALILYSTMTDTSMVQMFMAGYVPGIMMCAAEMIVVHIVCKKNGWQTRSQRATWKEILGSTLSALPAIAVMIVLMVGVRMGLFTLIEGAVVVIALCFCIGLSNRELKVKDIPGTFVETFHTAGDIMVLIIGSLLFGYYLTWARIPQDVSAALMNISSNKFVFILLSMALMIVMGMFMDATAMLMIVTPILFPVSQAFGISPIQYGIMMILNGYIGSLTPPVGGVMYICCNLLNVSVPEFFKHCKGFILALAIVMVLICLFPQLTTFLPTLIYG